MKGYKNVSLDILLFYLKSETIQQEEGRPLETLFFYTLNSTIFFNSKMISPDCHMPLPYTPCPTPLALCHSPYAICHMPYAVRRTPYAFAYTPPGKRKRWDCSKICWRQWERRCEGYGGARPPSLTSKEEIGP